MAFRELTEEEVTRVKLILFKLYASARSGETPDQKVDETFEDIMEIFYKSSMDFSFVEKFWGDFNHVPKTIDYLVDFLRQNKDVKRIGNTFKTKFIKLFKEILIDCENEEVTLTSVGAEVSDYDIKQYSKHNIPYWNKILEEALELYDNHWFISFIEPYASKCEFFMFLPKHLENPKLSRDNKALIKRIIANTKSVFFKTEGDNIQPTVISHLSPFLHYCSRDIDIYTYLYNIRRSLIVEVLESSFVYFILTNEKSFDVFKEIYERFRIDFDTVKVNKVTTLILYWAIYENCNKVIEYILPCVKNNNAINRGFTSQFILCFNNRVDLNLVFKTYKIYLDIEEIESNHLRYIVHEIISKSKLPLRDIFGIDMTYQEYLKKYDWIKDKECVEENKL